MPLSFSFGGNNLDPLPVDFVSRNGSWKINATQRAVAATLGAYPTAFATVDFTQDCTIEADINCNVSSGEGAGSKPTGFGFRYIDNDNYLNVAISNSGGDVVFLRRTAGAFVNMTRSDTTEATPYSIPGFDGDTDYRLSVTLSGSTIEVRLDTVLIATLTEIQGQTSAEHGVHTFSAYGTVDNMTYAEAAGDSISVDLENNQSFHALRGASRSVTVSGAYNYSGSTSISYRVDGGSPVVGQASPAANSYTFNIAELQTGHYDVEVFLTDDPTVTTTITRLTIAPAVHGAGQSNMECVGTNNQTLIPNGSTTATLLGFDYVWKEMVDPWSDHTNQVDLIADNTVPIGGSWLIHFANNYLSVFSDPIILVPNARGSRGIDAWQKDSTTRIDNLNLYEAMAKRIAATDGAVYVLYQGCETDLINDRPTDDVKADLHQFVNDVFADFGCKVWIVPMYTYKPDPFDGDGITHTQTQYRQMQIEVAQENPNAEIVQSLADLDILAGAADDLGQNDGVHAKTDGVLTEVGDRVFQSIYPTTPPTVNTTLIGQGIPDGTYTVDFVYGDVGSRSTFQRQVAFTSNTADVDLSAMGNGVTFTWAASNPTHLWGKTGEVSE